MAGERILIVDDEPGVRSMLEAILKDDGYAVESVASGEDGLAAAAARPAEGILLDVWLPGIDGLTTLERLRDAGSDAEVVMISGHGTIDTAVRATKLGAFDFVEKPLSLEKTLLVLRNALRQRRLLRRNRALLEQLARDTDFLGASESAERVRREADAAAAVEAPVLLCGEPGSGRETIARRIHAASRRADQPLVQIPGRALDAATGAAVLFGDGAHPGRLDLARRGSVFLEDVDALPGPLQERLAGWLTGRPDVRLLASASPDATGLTPSLRQHLDVMRIQVPPLRERREDIHDIVHRFQRDLSREYGRPDRTFGPEATAALVRHDWPGNLRELRNAVERVVLLARGEEIGPADLPAEMGGDASEIDDLYRSFPSLAEGLKAFERYFLRRLLREARGDVALAARRAGIPAAELRKALG
jgi:two-component system nitrogen regulation response regulator NtrX